MDRQKKFMENKKRAFPVHRWAGNFILKGGLLLVCLRVHWSRPTKDVDFLARGVSNTAREIEDIFKTIAGLSYDDGVYFDSSSISSERIIEDTDYEGMRVKITAGLGKAKKILKFDIGFGDTVWPEPGFIEFPALLEEEPPKIKAYSIESVIAEKFEIMLKLEMINSRMKDFYDIYNLSCVKRR